MPVEIDEKEAKKKLVKVTNKTTVKAGKLQTTTHDGRNFLADYPMGASLLISLPDQKVEKVLELKKGALVSSIGGKHKGLVGKLSSEGTEKKGTLLVESEDKTYEIPKRFVFVVGEAKPEVTLK